MAKNIVEKDLIKVQELCRKVLGEDYLEIGRMGGLTNHTYHIALKNAAEYVVRIPGDGTEEMINRADEKRSTMLACDLGIDAQCLYFGDDGSKVTGYITDALTMSSELLKEDAHIRQMAEIFRKLHGSGRDTGVAFEVFDMAAGYENIIRENNVAMYVDYEAVKEAVMKIKEEVDECCDIKKVPCHNDALCENWITQGKNGRMYLVDWEYAGMNDAMWDLADVSIEAGYGRASDEKLLQEYYGRDITALDWKRFLANKIYVDFLWTLWAKTRVPYDGQPMEDWAGERYVRLKENIENYRTIKKEGD